MVGKDAGWFQVAILPARRRDGALSAFTKLQGDISMNAQSNVVPWPGSELHPSEGGSPFPDMVWIPGGAFAMGSNSHYPEEAPVHNVSVSGFWMDKFTVTNAQFSTFVEETNYVTV